MPANLQSACTQSDRNNRNRRPDKLAEFSGSTIESKSHNVN